MLGQWLHCPHKLLLIAEYLQFPVQAQIFKRIRNIFDKLSLPYQPFFREAAIRPCRAPSKEMDVSIRLYAEPADCPE